MQRRLVEFVDPTGNTHVIHLLDDEELVLPIEVNPLKPIRRLSAGRALELLADLHRAKGPLRQQLGSTEPLVASRAGVENGDNPLAELYGAKFGRDSMIMASFLEFYRDLERNTVIYWAEREGRVHDAETHEEPGGRIHEERPDPNDPQRKRLEAGGMRFPDFGTKDAPALWCIALLREAKQDPAFANTRVTHYRDGDSYTLADSFLRTISLFDGWRSANSERVVESEAVAGNLKSFPYWKDSPDAYHHRNGELAHPPVSSVEMMAYLYDTFAEAAELAVAQPELLWNAAEFRAKADDVRASLVEHYWVDERGGFFALGTDRDTLGGLRKLEVRSSNMGYLLDSGILEGEEMRPYREATVRQLMSPDMLCPAGIRTSAADELRFEPSSYHNGAVWPHDTYAIARGMRRHYPELAVALFDCVARCCTNFLPEHVPGTASAFIEPNRLTVRVRTINVYGEPITRAKIESCQPIQGWAAAALSAVKHHRRAVVREAAQHASMATRDAMFAAEVLDLAYEGGLASVSQHHIVTPELA